MDILREVVRFPGNSSKYWFIRRWNFQKFKSEFLLEIKAPVVFKISTLKLNAIHHTLITLTLKQVKYLMSRFKMMTRTTIVLPIRSVLTRMENIAVIPICAASESVYSDIVQTIVLYVVNKQ